MTKIILISALSIFLMVIPSQIAMSHLILYTFEGTIENAELIIIGEVVKIKKSLIGHKYARIRPVSYIKGNSDEDHFIIKYDEPFYMAQEDLTEFEEGKEYVLFMRMHEEYHYLVGQAGQYSIGQNGYVFRNLECVPLELFVGEIKKMMIEQEEKNEMSNKAL